MTLTDKLRSMDACAVAIAWAETQPDLATAWRKCERIDWLCWLAGRVIDDRTMRHLACDFSEAAWEFAGEGDVLLQCMLTVGIARGYADGTEGEETRAAAEYAARAAAESAPWDTTRAAAWSCAWSCTRHTPWYSAWDAARSAPWDAARPSAWYAARDAANKKQLRIMRKRITAEMICSATGVK